MRRITKAALGGLAGCALALGGMQGASGETLLQQVFPGWLTDLDTNGEELPYETTGAFDSARAKLKVTETSEGNTTFRLEVKYIKPGFEQKFGSHLHTGSCEGYDLTGGHYQHVKDDLKSEVWFSLEPKGGDEAVSSTVVDFVPKDPDGVMSIVIHAQDTNPETGKAGDKEVCLPLQVDDSWVQAPPVIETP